MCCQLEWSGGIKRRGYTHLTGKVKEDNGYKYKKEPTDTNFKETSLYIS